MASFHPVSCPTDVCFVPFGTSHISHLTSRISHLTSHISHFSHARHFVIFFFTAPSSSPSLLSFDVRFGCSFCNKRAVGCSSISSDFRPSLHHWPREFLRPLRGQRKRSRCQFWFSGRYFNHIRQWMFFLWYIRSALDPLFFFFLLLNYPESVMTSDKSGEFLNQWRSSSEPWNASFADVQADWTCANGCRSVVCWKRKRQIEFYERQKYLSYFSIKL